MSISYLLSGNIDLNINDLKVNGVATGIGFTGSTGSTGSVGPTGPVGGSSSDTLLSGTISGAFSDTYVYRITSIVNGSVTHVMLHFPSDVQHATSADILNFSAVIPSNLRPKAGSNVLFPIIVDSNSALSLGLLTINASAGSISMGVGAGGGNFAGTGFAGIPGDIFISYDLSNNQ
jgi:hypothetical protein